MLLSAPMATNAHRLKPAGSTSASTPSKAALAALRPSTATGAPMSFPRRTAHSPTPSNGSVVTTSPSSTSLQSLSQPTSQPSAYTFSGLKSRLSTKQKSKGKRSFTGSGNQSRSNATVNISPPTPAIAPMPTTNGRPNPPMLKTQKSVDSAMMIAASGAGSMKSFTAVVSAMPPPSATATTAPPLTASPQIPSMYDTVHEIAEKRINTLDYLRRACV
ncbi:hypothetical protein ABW19_dt0205952 [Dactylella cylindrospora]|nr:hypothetical protein ABW19_dt0205952 [Dactylella cylindrospora]